jgi:hypothetical protein
MKDNHDAIYATTASPFKKYIFDGRATVKGNTLYLHVFSWPGDTVRVAGLTTRVSRAYALRGGATLQHETSTDERGIPVLTIRKPTLIDPSRRRSWSSARHAAGRSDTRSPSARRRGGWRSAPPTR